MNVMTDNRNRTASEIRKVFDKHGGQLGGAGAAAWAFEEKGLISLSAESATEEALFEVAVGAGAEDIQRVGDRWAISTPREVFDAVSKALEGARMQVLEAQIAQVAKTPKVVEGSDGEKLMALHEALEDHDDVQKVFADFELSDAALAALG